MKLSNYEIEKLANDYENKVYFKDDPVSFLWEYTIPQNIEIAAVICSVLAFGRREQIWQACQKTLQLMGDSPYHYVLARRYTKYEKDTSCWYRMYKMEDFAALCDRLAILYDLHETLQDALEWQLVGRKCFQGIYQIGISEMFGNLHTFPKPTSTSCKKRINLMLRWLVRQNSLVDVGIWKELDPKYLLIPCDVHVLNTARKLALLRRRSNDATSCFLLSERCRKIIPDDPCKLDYFLFTDDFVKEHTNG